MSESIKNVVVDSYFPKDGSRLVKHQIDSFNNFINNIENIIEDNNPIISLYNWNDDLRRYMSEYHIKLININISKQIVQDDENNDINLYPSECRKKDLTYNAIITCDIVQYIRKNDEEDITKYVDTNEVIKKNVILTKIPIMLNSKYCKLNEETFQTKKEMGECKYELGGYFIISGSEKVLISIEKKCENKILIFPQTKGQNNSTYSHIVEVKSVNKNSSLYVKNIQIKLTSKETSGIGKTIKVQIPKIKTDVPLFMAFRILGDFTDKDIVNMIIYDEEDEYASEIMNVLLPSLEISSPFNTKKKTLKYLVKQMNVQINTNENEKKYSNEKLNYLENMILKEFLPHLGDNTIKKALYLGLMTRKLILNYLGYLNYDDRDSFLNKRIETPGILLENLFIQHYIKLTKDIKKSIEKDLSSGKSEEILANILKKIKNNSIENGIKYSLSTGNWGFKNNIINTGIAQVLNRISFPASLSHKRRVIAPMEKTGKQTAPRTLHGTQFKKFCPAETPEGSSIGLVKNLSIMCEITNKINPETIISYLDELNLIKLTECNIKDILHNTKVFLNGDWLGIIYEPNEFITKFKNMRRKGGIIHPHVSISWNMNLNEININSDSGRLVVPHFIVENNNILLNDKIINDLEKKKIFFEDLLIEKDGRKAIIEYLDVEEEDNQMIAASLDVLRNNKKSNDIYSNFTHCEIHNSNQFGVIGCKIPFSNHNQAPRNMYNAAQDKQAFGIPLTNFRNRLDTVLHVLHYPQRPLVNTEFSKYVLNNEIPSGQNPIVAIMNLTGMNQEDSLIINKTAIERGLYASSSYRTYKDVEKKQHDMNREEKFMKITNKSKIIGSKSSSYDKIDDNGFIKVGSKVDQNDIIISKIITLKNSKPTDPEYKDISVTLKNNDSGYVDTVYSGKNGDGYKFVKIRIRKDRNIDIGDKFSSRHGQKGTIGIPYNSIDLPYTKDGIVPELIVNTAAIPSRMTIGQLVECVLGKVCSFNGFEGDATPFSGFNVDDIDNLLSSYGFDDYGKEVMYNGVTGEVMNALVFIGPTFYYRLKHLVADKIHCLTLDHEILTDHGWKYFNQINDDDKLASLNNNHQLIYEKPTKKLLFENYSGNLYHIDNENISLSVTHNHRMLVSKNIDFIENFQHSFSLIPINNLLNENVYYKKSAINSNIDFQSHENMDKWIEFNAYLLAYFTYKLIDNKIIINPEKYIPFDKLIKLFRELKFDSQFDFVIEDSLIDKITIINKNLFNYLSLNNFDWLFKLSERQMKLFINTIFVDNKFNTNDEKFADLIMHLALYANISINKNLINKNKDQNIENMILEWELIITENEPLFLSENIKIENFIGPVFCFEMPNEIFMVRKNGKAVWTGNSRSSGPYQGLTKQPTEGRSRDGGLRLGEMERDCFLSHGIIHFLKERFFDVSDKYLMYICKKCNLPAIYNVPENLFICKYCDNQNSFAKVRIPYATKLLLQELMACGIAPKIITGSV